VVSSFQEKLTTMEAENQLLRQQVLLRMPVRTIPENRSPKSVCGLFTPDLSVPSSLVEICDHFRLCLVQMLACWCLWLPLAVIYVLLHLHILLVDILRFTFY
jgi:hypothetical protein